MGLKQISLKAKGQSWRLATAFDLWGRKIKVTGLVVPTPTDAAGAGKGPVEGSGLTGITVTGPGFEDTWNWGKSADATTPTPIKAQRKGGWSVTVDEKDKAPSGLAEPVGNTVKKP
jgi:hypothetical protein